MGSFAADGLQLSLKAVLLVLCVGGVLGYLFAHYEQEYLWMDRWRQFVRLALMGVQQPGFYQLGDGNQSVAALPISALLWFFVKKAAQGRLAAG